MPEIPVPTCPVLWLVYCSQGHYSDHAAWVVCAYLTKERAEEHAAAGNRWIADWYQFERTFYDEHNYYPSYNDFPCPVDETRYGSPQEDAAYHAKPVTLVGVPSAYRETARVAEDWLREQGYLP